MGWTIPGFSRSRRSCPRATRPFFRMWSALPTGGAASRRDSTECRQCPIRSSAGRLWRAATTSCASSHHKALIDPQELNGLALKEYARVCGEVLAKAHARTGDAAILYGYCGDTNRLDRAIGRFAIAYADQTESDHAAFVKAI